jgi:hypothetical protein
MICTDYEPLIGEYVDGDLDAPARAALERHLAACEPCRRLAEDLRAIRAAAMTLEPHAPPPCVWTRITAALVDEGAGLESPPIRTRWRRPSLAAGLIVAVLAVGVSWIVWRDVSRVTPPANTRPEIASPASPDQDPLQPLEADLKLAEDDYVKAIAGLEAIAGPAGSALDPQTADVLQASLIVIDRAIGESRAALQTDPASDLAQESLFDALRNKVFLLQETVLLINEMRQGDQEGAARIISNIRQ